jgi:hypothetical protein
MRGDDDERRGSAHGGSHDAHRYRQACLLLTRAVDLPTLGELRRKRWASATPPAVTTLVVAALARPELLVESR